MMQNRLKDNNRGGYVDDKYRSHDNFTNAFNMLAQIGLAEKGLTNQGYEAVNQASNAYTARKEQEFKKDSWIADKKLKLSNEYRGEKALRQEQARTALDSRMTSFQTDHLEAFTKAMESLKASYGGNTDDEDYIVGKNTIIEEFNDEYTAKYREELNLVNEEYSGVMDDLIKYADTDAEVFNMLDTTWTPPSTGYEDKKNLVLEPIDGIINKYGSFRKNSDLNSTGYKQSEDPTNEDTALPQDTALSSEKNNLVARNKKVWDELVARNKKVWDEKMKKYSINPNEVVQRPNPLIYNLDSNIRNLLNTPTPLSKDFQNLDYNKRFKSNLFDDIINKYGSFPLSKDFQNLDYNKRFKSNLSKFFSPHFNKGGLSER